MEGRSCLDVAIVPQNGAKLWINLANRPARFDEISHQWDLPWSGTIDWWESWPHLSLVEWTLRESCPMSRILGIMEDFMGSGVSSGPVRVLDSMATHPSVDDGIATFGGHPQMSCPWPHNLWIHETWVPSPKKSIGSQDLGPLSTWKCAYNHKYLVTITRSIL